MLYKIYIVVMLISVAVSQCVYFSDETQNSLYSSDINELVTNNYPHSLMEVHPNLESNDDVWKSLLNANQQDINGMIESSGFRRSSPRADTFQNAQDVSDDSVYGKQFEYSGRLINNQRNSGEQGYSSGSKHQNYQYQQQSYNPNQQNRHQNQNSRQHYDGDQAQLEKQIYQQVNPMPQGWYKNQPKQQSSEYNSQGQTYQNSNAYSQGQYEASSRRVYNSQQQSSEESSNSYEGGQQNKKHSGYTQKHYNSEGMQQQNQDVYGKIRTAAKQFVPHDNAALGAGYIKNMQGSRGGDNYQSSDESSSSSSSDSSNAVPKKSFTG